MSIYIDSDHYTKYRLVAEYFKAFCRRYHIPTPKVSPALDTDPCDYTDSTTVRINVKVAMDIPAAFHAAHVFGHYICCLHAAGDEATDKRGAWCDLVANAIGRMICDIEYKEVKP